MSDKPIKDNLSKKVFEYEAKLTLEQIFPKYHFEIKDKPDLQDEINDIGVEVTQLINNEATGVFTKYCNAKTKADKEKRKQYLEKMGCIVGDGIMAQLASDPIEESKATFKSKVKKLQKGYRLFKSNCLLIFDPIIDNKAYLTSLLNGFMEIQKNSQIKYDKVFAVTGNMIAIFDLNKCSYFVEYYENQTELALQARSYVENSDKKRS